MSGSKKPVAQKPQKKIIGPLPYDPNDAPFNWDKLDGLLAYKATLLVCSDILEVGKSTLKVHIKKRYGLTFTEYGELKLSRTKVKLVSKAIEMALSGNATMLIFSLKNLCKWQDKLETEVINSGNTITVTYSKDAN